MECSVNRFITIRGFNMEDIKRSDNKVYLFKERSISHLAVQ